jgi:putative ABC transport system permease protein
MRLGLLELIRKPGRFVVVGVALSVLVVLMLFLAGLLDGLYKGSTGAIRAADPDLVVYSDDARESFLRSSIDQAELNQILAVEDVTEVGGFGITLLGVQIPGESDLADGAIVGYELPSGTLPEPPGFGEALADRTLEDAGAAIGDRIAVGPAASEIEIVGWVDDTNYLLQSGIWVAPETWRTVQNENRPDAPVGDTEFQSAMVRIDSSADAEVVAAQIDDSIGSTETRTQSQAISAIPGIEEQTTTFTYVIVATVVVSALVVALFFALLTVERTALYAMLKALGSSSFRLVVGLGTQALAIAFGSFAVGGAITFGLAQVLPPEIPTAFEPSRVFLILLAVCLTSLLGSLISLRRITRIDPAAALGAGV